MLIKITECCSNGCKHCMNNNIKCEKHMSIDTFVDTLKFCKKYDDNIFGNMICGGEPYEHPDFEKFIDIYYQMYNPNFCLLSVIRSSSLEYPINFIKKSLALFKSLAPLPFNILVNELNIFK